MAMREWPKYRRGYSTRDYHVTGGHEAEAQAAQRRKKPSRFAVRVLRLLGFKGPIPDPRPARPVSPHHQGGPRPPGQGP